MKKPPRIADGLLRILYRSDPQQAVLHDLEEQFIRIFHDAGGRRARAWYLVQTIGILRGRLFNRFYWSIPMFKNYMVVAFRNMKRQKGYSFINITGLAVGMACCILILMWVQDETSYDRFHRNAEYIHRVIVERTIHNTFRTPNTPPVLGATLVKDYPEITRSVRLFPVGFSLRYGKDDEGIFNEPGIVADPALFEMFTFPLLSGDPGTVLAEPNSVVISATTARICFGDENPLGRMMRFDNEDPLRVTGVMEDVPENSHLDFHFVVPLHFFKQKGWTFDTWDGYRYHTYIQLEAGHHYREVNEKIAGIVEAHTPDSQSEVILIPLNRLHLVGIDGDGPMTYVIIFSIVAVGVLLIACINFTNLTTARSARRAREIGLRKTIGARRSELVKQFLGETILHAVLAFLCAVFIVAIALPGFNTLSGKSFDLVDLLRGEVLLGLAGMAVLTGMAAGLYPAFFLSGLRPVSVMQGSAGSGSRRPVLRRGLVITQFFLSVMLMICTLGVRKQLEYIRNRDLGFQKEGLVYLRTGNQARDTFDALKSDLKQHPSIAGVTYTNASLTFLGIETTNVEWDGKQPDQELSIQIRTVDPDYLETFGLHMQEGRFFRRDFSTDATEGYVINETAVRLMGLESPVGQRISLMGMEGTIIGVVRDFHHHSLHDRIEPLIFCMNFNMYTTLFARLRPGMTSEGIEVLRLHWDRIDPGYAFRYTYLEDKLSDLYRTEQQTGAIIRTFSFLALFIAGLGLFGLASYTAEQRTKEIGVRKVLGASVTGVVLLLSKEFSLWVLIANALAWPASYLWLHQWLQRFAYRAEPGIGLFLFSGLAVLSITILTVSSLAFRAALANPVDSLRYE